MGHSSHPDGMTQRQVAAILGISHAMVSKIERKALRKLAHALDAIDAELACVHCKARSDRGERCTCPGGL